jgi:DNA-binding MarR family transcriptional regulator
LRLESLLTCLQPLQSELSLPQLLALFQIALNPGLSVNELGERLSCPQQTASRHVAALLGRYQGEVVAIGAQGGSRSKLEPLITQEISQSDPRSRALSLSKHGVVFVRELLMSMSTSTKLVLGGGK